MAEPYSLVADLTRLVNKCVKQNELAESTPQPQVTTMKKQSNSESPFASKSDAQMIAQTLQDMLDDFQSMRVYSVNYVIVLNTYFLSKFYPSFKDLFRF